MINRIIYSDGGEMRRGEDGVEYYFDPDGNAVDIWPPPVVHNKHVKIKDKVYPVLNEGNTEFIIYPIDTGTSVKAEIFWILNRKFERIYNDKIILYEEDRDDRHGGLLHMELPSYEFVFITTKINNAYKELVELQRDGQIYFLNDDSNDKDNI